jgi:hypothetical protein
MSLTKMSVLPRISLAADEPWVSTERLFQASMPNNLDMNHSEGLCRITQPPMQPTHWNLSSA